MGRHTDSGRPVVPRSVRRLLRQRRKALLHRMRQYLLGSGLGVRSDGALDR